MKLLRRHFGVVAIILKKKGTCTSINLCQNCILYCAVMVYFILYSYTTTFFYCCYCLLIYELFVCFFWGGGVQDDAEAQGSSGSQEKESNEEKMETSTEVCLQLINLKFPRTTTMQQEGGILV